VRARCIYRTAFPPRSLCRPRACVLTLCSPKHTYTQTGELNKSQMLNGFLSNSVVGTPPPAPATKCVVGGGASGVNAGGGGGADAGTLSTSVITWQTVSGKENVEGSAGEAGMGGRGGGKVSPTLNGVSALRDRKARG